ncbi:glycosyltransferase family 1 protein [Oscillatoria sp. FACHB-1407]|uniref:glycosyltransferase family 1 protein n=1 Tax=Oscillatoria sp. FACHB-1407 TaxID=2692847 RepID=UPI0016835FEF|nr:glycosyltransferase family 1 protein [Oscillatoria sp. FACHB-1407]MBD2461879.1 glycosyltransferase family 1 protein [Oscillatoria sp. FACHB-1407]
MKVAQIVPRLPPYTDGVGDYAVRLAGQLLKAHQINTQFIIFKPGPKNSSELEYFPIAKLSEHTTQALLEAIPQDINNIILHYSNYPYLQNKWDAPFWLVDGLRAIKQQYSVKLIVMFHELPTLKWRHFKVLNPIQAIASRRLAEIADTVMTDSSNFKKHLAKWTQSDVPCIPDFSTIGEPETVVPLHMRDRRLIVFGGHDRQRVYKNHLPTLLQTCQALGIEEVCDIGATLDLDASRFGNVRLVQKGFQSAEAVQHLMSTSFAGLMDYTPFPGDLGKSSVFAAFCAHGLLPVCTTYNPSEADGIYANQQYLVAGKQLEDFRLAQLQAIATQAHTWYSHHSLAKNTDVFASYLHHPI